MRYVSSENFSEEFPDVTGCRLDAVRKYETGHKPGPCMMLAKIALYLDTSSPKRVHAVRIVSEQVINLVVAVIGQIQHGIFIDDRTVTHTVKFREEIQDMHYDIRVSGQ